MADEVTCPVCGREKASKGTPGYQSGICFRATHDDRECYRLGYEREKARAEKAVAKAAQYERDWYAAKSEFGTAMAKSREALAAARRECEGLRTMLRAVRPLVREEFLGAGAMTERGWEALLARLDAALAAPAEVPK